MKAITIAYRICTGILILALGTGSVMDVFSMPESIEVFSKLGYPVYLAPFFGIARLCALCVIVIPVGKLPRLKEWAYAGLTFDMAGAVYSQIALKNPFSSWIFLFLSVLFLSGSYILYHKKLNQNRS